jgi:glycosyltransferase involved in cell wall biosynthesis
MKWFYDALDMIYVNSEGYRRAWIDRGIAPAKLRILPRGLDTSLFHPSRREPDFWTKRGAMRGSRVLLYVGRISKEKDLNVIVAAWARMKGCGIKNPASEMTLAFVGEGPYRPELQRMLPDAIFTGVLAGHELATAFASADLFLFPSTTDTFGNVILEALASGVPCVVSDQGGPKDLIEPGVTGRITKALDAQDFAHAVVGMVADESRLSAMREAARISVESRDWSEAGRRFWTMAEEAVE